MQVEQLRLKRMLVVRTARVDGLREDLGKVALLRDGRLEEFELRQLRQLVAVVLEDLEAEAREDSNRSAPRLGRRQKKACAIFRPLAQELFVHTSLAQSTNSLTFA